MALSHDEVFRRIAVAKGDIPASIDQQRQARTWYRKFIHRLTTEAQQAHPGELSITHETVQAALERNYREYRRRKSRAATRRLLQDES